MKRENAAIIISILLALVVKVALEHFFEPIFDQNKLWASVPTLHWAQLFLVFVLVLRFYLGATRYIDCEPRNLSFPARAINFVLPFLLFCTFFVVALAANDSGYFFLLVIVLHVVDIAWFALAFLILWVSGPADETQSPGEIEISAIKRVMLIFLCLSLVTVAYAFISYMFLFKQSLFEKEAISAHWSFWGILVFLSGLDFVFLRKYYFDHQTWQEENRVMA
jgi:hypothetical protein